ncbi:MAG TPA: rhodanese-like domain-containing protein [Candidatus Limnocylindrales bacterium]
MTIGEAGPLVSGEWLAAWIGEPGLHVIHVSADRKAYDEGHVPGALFSDLHVDMAKTGTRPETGTAKRVYLVPTREETAESLARWGVKSGEHIVFYDDSQGRQGIRGYWLLRLYRFPKTQLHVLDGGLPVWTKEGRALTTVEPKLDATDPAAALALLGDRDDSLIATADEVLAWNRESSAPNGATRLLDVRRIDEFLGRDVVALRGGHIPGARHRVFTDFVAVDGRLRPAADILSVLQASGVDPAELRATYCQGGVRAALAWFALSEVAGLQQVRNYAESWEEWGNRPDLPID